MTNNNRHLQRYLNHIEQNFADSTVSNRRVTLRQYYEFIDGVEIEDIDEYEPDNLSSFETWHIIDFKDHLLSEEYAPRSIRTKIYTITNYAKFLSARNVAENNIDVEETTIDKLKGNKISEFGKDRYIDTDEWEDMMDNARNLRNKILLKLMWDTGVRASEAVSIKIDDINRDNREIEVENAKQTELSSKSETRTVYYSLEFDLLLDDWIRHGRDSYMYTGSDDDEGHLLVTQQSPRMAVQRVNEIVKETADRAGLQDLANPDETEEEDTGDYLYKDAGGNKRYKYTSHSIRHSFAIHRVKQGCPIVYLQDLLGHSDIDVTRQYLHFRGEDIKEAYDKYSP